MKIFLSYASEHRDIAECICIKLVNAGHDVFFDRQNLQPGLPFDLKIKSEIQACDLFVFLLSRESIEPGSYTLTELDLAQRKWPNPEGRVLVVDQGNLEGQGIPPYLRANTLLTRKGDLATETLFAVQEMASRRRVVTHSSIVARRLAIPSAVVLLAAGAMWLAYQAFHQTPTSTLKDIPTKREEPPQTPLTRIVDNTKPTGSEEPAPMVSGQSITITNGVGAVGGAVSVGRDLIINSRADDSAPQSE